MCRRNSGGRRQAITATPRVVTRLRRMVASPLFLRRLPTSAPVSRPANRLAPELAGQSGAPPWLDFPQDLPESSHGTPCRPRTRQGASASAVYAAGRSESRRRSVLSPAHSCAAGTRSAEPGRRGGATKEGLDNSAQDGTPASPENDLGSPRKPDCRCRISQRPKAQAPGHGHARQRWSAPSGSLRNSSIIYCDTATSAALRKPAKFSSLVEHRAFLRSF